MASSRLRHGVVYKYRELFLSTVHHAGNQALSEVAAVKQQSMMSREFQDKLLEVLLGCISVRISYISLLGSCVAV